MRQQTAAGCSAVPRQCASSVRSDIARQAGKSIAPGRLRRGYTPYRIAVCSEGFIQYSQAQCQK